MAKTAKTNKKEVDKKLLLRLNQRAFKAVKESAERNNRSVNGEIEYALMEKYA